MDSITAVNLRIEFHSDGCRLAYVETHYEAGILETACKLPLSSSITEALVDLANRMEEHDVPGWRDYDF